MYKLRAVKIYRHFETILQGDTTSYKVTHDILGHFGQDVGCQEMKARLRKVVE